MTVPYGRTQLSSFRREDVRKESTEIGKFPRYPGLVAVEVTVTRAPYLDLDLDRKCLYLRRASDFGVLNQGFLV